MCCLLLVALVITIAPVLYAQEPAAPAAPAESAKATDPMIAMEAMVEKALAAYNKQDFKAFYADFAKSMEAIATEQAFQTMYVGMYMKDYGQYKSRELLKDKCSVADDSPVALLQYKAVFEKNPAITIGVNFTKEGDAWKLMQIQFNKQ